MDTAIVPDIVTIVELARQANQVRPFGPITGKFCSGRGLDKAVQIQAIITLRNLAMESCVTT